MTARIGSLCSGYAGLDMAIESVLDAEPAWFAQFEPGDKHQHATKILAHHWPQVPNHGDITAIDYTTVEPIDVLTAGFPCTDISLAGKRAGLREGTRSGIWSHVARAIGELRPNLVFIENVRSLTSARADSGMEFCPWCLGDDRDQPALRALGAVLGDLADLGFDAQWCCVRAADIGAPHKRERIFVLAWPTDAPDLRHQRNRLARDGWTGPEDGRLTVADAAGTRLEEGGQGRSRAGVDPPFVPSVVAQLLPTPTVADSRGTRNTTSGRKQDSNHHDGTTLCDAIQLLPTSLTGESTGPPSTAGSESSDTPRPTRKTKTDDSLLF